MPRARILYGIPTRDYRRRYEFGTIDLGVPCVGEADAPVAAEADWVSTYASYARIAKETYRWSDGVLWQPMALGHSDERWKDSVSTPDGYGFVRELSSWMWSRVPLTGDEREIVKELNPVRSSERAYKRGPDLTDAPGARGFLEAAKNLLFVDDVLYRRSFGPILQLTADPHEDAVVDGVMRRVMLDRSTTPYGNLSGLFVHDAHEILEEVIGTLNLEVVGGRDAREMAGGFKVHRPDLLDPRRLDDVTLVETARELMNGLGVAKLKDIAAPCLRHLLSLRAAFDDFTAQDLAEGRRAGMGWHRDCGKSFIARDVARIRGLVSDFQDPELIRGIPPESALFANMMLVRLGLEAPLELDDAALGGMAP